MNIPQYVTETISNNNTQRVILLVMSTLPDKENASIETYQHPDDIRFSFKGISQLEAGTKYYLQKLGTQNKRIDRIVIVASPETIANNEWYGASALEVYKSRIIEYIKNGVSNNNYGLADKYPNKKENEFSGTSLYGKLDGLFKEIKDDEPENINVTSVYKGISTQKLLQTRDEIIGEAEKIELYFDMQGGFRNDIPLFNTILELLSDKSVTVAERVATDFYWKNEVQPMKTVDDLYKSYDLVTAYQIFKKYGWGTQLAEYFDESDSAENAIARAISEISDSIKICNIDGFDRGLDNLSNAIRQWKESDHANSEMNFIINDIEKDYRTLISRDSIAMKYIEQIKWCLRKDFIQQAVTIFESKVPAEFVHNAIYYYCNKHDNRQVILNGFVQIYNNYVNNRKTYETYKLADINHYWVKYYARDNNKGNVNIRGHYGNDQDSQLEANAISLIRKYINICKKRNNVNHAIENVHNSDGFFKLIQLQHPENALFGSTQNLDVSEIKDFIKDFEGIAAAISSSTKENVVDLS